MQVSVKKKAYNDKDVTPMHYACINPDKRYVEALMEAEPDFNHPDRDSVRSIHYAAVRISLVWL